MRNVPVTMNGPDMKRIGIGETTIVGKTNTNVRIVMTMSTYPDKKIDNQRTIGVATPNPKTMGKTDDLKIRVRWRRISPMLDKWRRITTDGIIDQSPIIRSNISTDLDPRMNPRDNQSQPPRQLLNKAS